jgi:hypothetical protein
VAVAERVDALNTAFNRKYPVIEGIKIRGPIVEEFSDFQLAANSFYHILSKCPGQDRQARGCLFLKG